MANLIAVLIARDAALGFDARRSGVAANPKRLTAYASLAAHGSLRRAIDFCGLGSDALRLVPVDAQHRMNLAALQSHDRIRPRRRVHAVSDGGHGRHGGHRALSTIWMVWR